jgi:hypothetical protein
MKQRSSMLCGAVLWVALAATAVAGDISMKAQLVDADAKAVEKTATVEVTVVGVVMTDPASVKEKPQDGQGHLHYRVDDGPAIATTATKLSFHDLKPGKHVFEVVLAGNDHKPLGPETMLSVTIP